MIATIEEVVGDGDAGSRRAQPVESVLPLLEEVGIARVVVVVESVLHVLDRTSIDEGIVLGAEESELSANLDAPMLVALAEREDISKSCSEACTFAYPSIILVATYLIEEGMGIERSVESLEGCLAVGDRLAVEVALVAVAEVVARFECVVAKLKILVVRGVAYPPGTVEVALPREVSVAWIVFHRHVGQWAPTIFWHVCCIHRCVGLDGEEFAAEFAVSLRYGVLLRCRVRRIVVDFSLDDGIREEVVYMDNVFIGNCADHDAHSTEVRKILAFQAIEECSALCLHEQGLGGAVVVGTTIDHGLDKFIVWVVLLSHHLHEEFVFLDDIVKTYGICIDAFSLEYSDDGGLSSFCQSSIVLVWSFRRGGTTSHDYAVGS